MRLRELLLERERESFVDVLNKYDSMPNIFVSFRSLPQFNINIKNTYDTPTGIYGYLLEELLQNNGQVDFAGNRPYAWIYTWNGKGRLLTSTDYSKTDLDQDTKTLMEQYPMLTTWEVLIKAKRAANSKTPLGILWNYTRVLSIALSETQGKKSADKWNKVFRSLNITGVNDNQGLGIIHINEPYQCVIFDPTAIKILRRYDKGTKDWNNKIENEYPGLLNLQKQEQLNLLGGDNNFLFKTRHPNKDVIVQAAKYSNKILDWAIMRYPTLRPVLLKNYLINFDSRIDQNSDKYKPYITQEIIDDAARYLIDTRPNTLEQIIECGFYPNIHIIIPQTEYPLVNQKDHYHWIKYYPSAVIEEYMKGPLGSDPIFVYYALKDKKIKFTPQVRALLYSWQKNKFKRI